MDEKRFDSNLYLLYRRIKLSLPQPLNLKQEQTKVFRDKHYNPGFSYQRLPNLRQVKEELAKMTTARSVFGSLLMGRRDSFLKRIALLESVGGDSFYRKAVDLYGAPEQSLARQALKLLSLEDEETGENRTSLTTVKRFLDSLLLYGLQWKVMEKEMVVGATFNAESKTLLINKNRKFSDADLKRLIVHEIGTHIVRAERAKIQKYRLFLMGFPNYLRTEEGLAVYNEEKAGLLDNRILRKYAGRVVAVDLALRNSFSVVYQYLCDFFSKEDAWMLTLRAKRGIGDTSRIGAFTKDYLYLDGYYKVKEFAKRDDIAKLYVGKIGVEHVPLLKHIA